VKKTVIISAILFIAGAVCAFALDIKGSAPTFTGGNPTIVNAFNNAVDTAFKDALKKLNEQYGNIDTKPEEFIKSWGDSQVFASSGATQRAYSDYKLFSFTIGPMVGFRLPGDPTKIMDDLDSITNKLEQDQDIKLGVNPQIFNARVGLNGAIFNLKKFYFGLHLGFINGDDLGLNELVPGFSFNTFSIGATVNYQFIPSLKLAGGLLTWRGLNFGSGIIFAGTKIGYSMGLETQSIDFEYNSATSTISIDPSMILDMKIDTVTIPLEAVTAVKVLWFLNIPLGVGADIAFGKSDMKIGMNGDINVSGLPGGITQSKKGNLSLSAGGDMAPTFFNLKLMTGVGFNFGPVVIDIPLTFYLDNGYSIGITIGAVW